MSERPSQGERCQECGRDYETNWGAPDALWNQVMGGPSGLLCPMCFDRKCRSLRIGVSWSARTTDQIEEECQALAALHHQFARAKEENERLRAERLSLAKLAADEPQFFNPLRVAEVQQMRDAILREAAELAQQGSEEKADGEA